MADQRIRLPAGGGGLLRYFDEYKSRFSFKPGSVIALTIIIIVLMIVLHTYFKSLFGL
ncbi:hypothetical protein DRJ16_04530 [Candidatus Woesearchaeota archaeon]|nr:MAG: hypothetical protein DRJ16_04530 [Candidatus Woesearchaeota archaeon]